MSPQVNGPEIERIRAIVRPLASAGYGVDYEWRALEWGLDSYRRDYGLNLLPDFQRGHVWTERQKEHFIENVLRGVIPPANLVIQFNCPHWDDHEYAGELPREMQIVDGLQRLTAVREFMAGKVRAFGMTIEQFEGTPFDPRRRTQFRFRFEIHNFARRADLLQHYLDINTGGTPHDAGEIERVRALLDEAAAANAQNEPAVAQPDDRAYTLVLNTKQLNALHALASLGVEVLTNADDTGDLDEYRQARDGAPGSMSLLQRLWDQSEGRADS